jgi:hypothetical protein
MESVALEMSLVKSEIIKGSLAVALVYPQVDLVALERSLVISEMIIGILGDGLGVHTRIEAVALEMSLV